MNKRILIIEDDKAIIEAMEIVLTEAGYDVGSVSDGEKAVKEIKKFSPHLVFLDMLMSGVDGRDVCAKIKADPGTKDTNVVMVSAHPTAKESVFKFGADEFLAKPFEVSDLLALAEKYTV